MIVNVSPAVENVSETKCSLEFASRARKVELGRARATIVSADGGVLGGGQGGAGSGNTGQHSVTASPAPSRPMSGRATPSGDSSMSRVGSREILSSHLQMRRSSGPSGLGR